MSNPKVSSQIYTAFNKMENNLVKGIQETINDEILPPDFKDRMQILSEYAMTQEQFQKYAEESDKYKWKRVHKPATKKITENFINLKEGNQNEIDLLNIISLGLFFLYFVLMSGSCGEILNCGLQRYINNSIWFKHIMIFLSIYIFTFILNWYTIDSIVIEKYENNENNKNNKNNENNKNNKNNENTTNKLKYLYDSFLYSILIYIIFVISTKTEGKYLAIFLILSVLLVFIQIILKALYGSYNNLNITDLFKSNTEIADMLNKKIENKEINNYDNNLIIILKVIPFIYIITFIILLLGFGKYYIRQKKDHKKNWDIIKFIFGNNKCKM